MAASPALDATRHLPTAGAHFPNACPQNGQLFETFPATYPLRVHYLPTKECLGAARARFGERADAVLKAWHSVWRSAVGDVDAYAREAGLKPLGPERPEDAPDEYPDWYGPNFIRPASFHVIEDAVALTEALRVGTPFVVAISPRIGSSRYFVPVPGVRRIVPYAVPSGCSPDSPFPPGDYVTPRKVFERVGAATPYWSQQAFRERAGRGMATAASPAKLTEILMDMAAQGHARAFLKDTGSKCGTWVVDIPPEGGDAEVSEAVRDALGPRKWERYAVQRRGRFLVQGMVPFVREHRFYVVAHRVAASTASDRMLSALDGRPDRILDERVARLDAPAGSAGYYDRGFSTWEVDRATVARMAWGARDLARALRADDRDMDCYVIDMGETRDGRVLPIEVNGMPRAGHYGVSYERVLRALRRRAERGREGHVHRVDPKRRGPDLSGHVAAATAMEVARILREGDEFRAAAFLRHRTPRRHPGFEIDSLDLHPVAPPNLDASGLLPAVPVPGSVEAIGDPGSPSRRLYLGYLARSVREGCLRFAGNMAHLVTDGIILHRRFLCMGATLAEEMASPGSERGWNAVDGDRLAIPCSWLVHVEASASDVDWTASIADSAVNQGIEIALRPGSRVRVVAVEETPNLPGCGGIVPGRGVVFGEVPPPPRRPDLSVLDRAGMLRHVQPPEDAWTGLVRDGSPAILSLIVATGGDPERWTDLGRTLAEAAEAHAMARRRSLVSKATDAVYGVRGDANGRICLVESGKPGRLRRWRERDGGDCACTVARLADLDVAAMASASLVEGGEAVILHPDAVTWTRPPVAAGAEKPFAWVSGEEFFRDDATVRLIAELAEEA